MTLDLGTAEMDKGLNMRFIEETVIAWIAGRQDDLGSITLNFVDTSDSSITLETNGRLLQIVIPSAFQMEYNFISPIASEEVFIVTSLDPCFDEVFQNSLSALNEKLERISIEPDALSQVLDQLLLALQKFKAKRDQQMNKGGRVVDCKMSDAQVLAQTNGVVQTDVSDHNCNELQSGESDAEEEEDSPDDYGYDLASSENINKGFDIQSRSKGFLFAMAEDAKHLCEVSRSKSDWTQLALDFELPDSIVQWCDIIPDFEFLRVHLLIQIGTIVRDDGAAAALGFSLDLPVKITLEFSKELWSQVDYNPVSCPLKPEKWRVTQEIDTSNKGPADAFDEETQKLIKIDQTHLYGIEVLLPELVCIYFEFLVNRTVSHVKKLESPNLLNELKEFSGMANPFIGLLYFLSARLRALPDWCVVCWNTLPYPVCRLRTCDREFCLFRFEELGLGTPVLQEAQKFPELIDFELSLAIAAAYSGRDVFEPFPAFLLEREEIRGRSGWFSKVERVDYSTTTAQTASRLAFLETLHKRNKGSEGANTFPENKNMKLLRDILQSYPSVKAMKDCANEVTLKKTLTKFWEKKFHSDRQNSKGKRPDESNESSEWTKKLWLPYDVLRFVLSTSRLTLYLLQGDERLDFAHAHYQFAVLHDSPEREAHFERRRIEQGGSFFAFHGSSADNWFSILRNGLRCLSNTAYMSTGASYGTGIYLASQMAISLGYCHFKGPGWEHGSLKEGFSVLAICEVINGSLRQSGVASSFASGIMVVPPEYEKDVAIRYIIVFKGQRQYDKEGHSIRNSSLSSNIDLMQHYQNVRSMYPIRQTGQRQARKEAWLQSMSETFHTKEVSKDHETREALQFTPGNAVGLSKKTQSEGEHSQTAVRKRTTCVDRVAPSSSAMQAISKEYKNILKQIKAAGEKQLQTAEEDLPILAGIKVIIPDESDLCRWRVSLSQGIFKSWPLYKDLTECARQWKVPEVPVELEFVFPATYPFAPPFVRVISPVFGFHTGHVTVGGSICMELLTDSGWSPACSFESVIVQIVNAMIEGGGRLDKTTWNSRREYSEREAREAFDRVARAHGWIKDTVPLGAHFN